MKSIESSKHPGGHLLRKVAQKAEKGAKNSGLKAMKKVLDDPREHRSSRTGREIHIHRHCENGSNAIASRVVHRSGYSARCPSNKAFERTLIVLR